LRAVARIGVRVAVAPVHDVARDRVGTRVGDGTQGEAVARALVHTRGAADRDRRRHVVDLHREGVGAVEEGAVLVDQVDGDVVVVPYAALCLRLRAVARIGV